mmetsp:Transcript_10099/g.17046  ORF Transcript_10099/g.17046 Transcript_10099/m.17046 type:complete len:115 (-) Transcript_10099:1359-1703(-)
MGIQADDDRIATLTERLDATNESKLTKDEFIGCIQEHTSIVEKTLSEDFVIPQFGKFKQEVQKIYENCKKNTLGKPADYIPELANMDPSLFGVSICTIDGQRLNVGDTKAQFSI